ncbi:MAG: hypothetical protein Q8914_01885 [Bacteroidota bacterium]|nr:hypothetical protein [Bacteroidota bacterium]
MNFLLKRLSIFTYLLLSTSFLLAQQEDNTAKVPVQMAIPPSAKLSLAGSNLHFSIVKDKGTEQIISPTTVGKVWLNYSSIVETNTANTIFASLSVGNLPAEVTIKLVVSSDAGAGYGQVGTPTEPIYLSLDPQPIITNIGTCYTGQGDNKGHLLTYSWELLPNYDPNIFSKEDLANLQVGVIYTIVTDE